MQHLVLSLLLLISLTASAQLTIRVTDIPSDTPENTSIYIAGNFQAWNPGDSQYQLKPDGKGAFVIEFEPNRSKLEFKFTRGSWQTVEGSKESGGFSNRTYNYDGRRATLELTIESWENKEDAKSSSTALSNVHILSENFYVPQLDRNRRIWIYLPPDYDTSAKKYPVLYMHDGQNVFDKSTSFSGEWKVDETLNKLHNQGGYGVIVVGIDNGQDHRMDEYSPWINAKYGGGEGDKYMEFIVTNLKTHIDSTFRTLSDRKYTGLMGSSMGGLISLYGGVEHQDVFSKIGVFSPSYWYSDKCFSHVQLTNKKHVMRIYTIMGKLEGEDMVSKVQVMENTLLKSGYNADEIKLILHDDDEHSEWYWAREFEAAYLWLYGDLELPSFK